MEKQYENHCQSIYKGKSEEEIKSLVRVEKEFVPTLSKDAASKLYSGWRQAVSKA